MRTARVALSRERIVASALRLTADRDLRDLPLKAIARDLGVTPMALYRYFPSKADLVGAVLDAFVTQAAVTGHGLDSADARAWLQATFDAARRALVERPGILALLADGSHQGDAALALVDPVLGVLRGAGLDPEEAVAALSALLAYTLGSAALETAGRVSVQGLDRDPAERTRQLEAGFSRLSRNQHPHVVACAPQLARAAVRYPFEAGLERLLAGLPI